MGEDERRTERVSEGGGESGQEDTGGVNPEVLSIMYNSGRRRSGRGRGDIWKDPRSIEKISRQKSFLHKG